MGERLNRVAALFARRKNSESVTQTNPEWLQATTAAIGQREKALEEKRLSDQARIENSNIKRETVEEETRQRLLDTGRKLEIRNILEDVRNALWPDSEIREPYVDDTLRVEPDKYWILKGAIYHNIPICEGGESEPSVSEAVNDFTLTITADRVIIDGGPLDVNNISKGRVKQVSMAQMLKEGPLDVETLQRIIGVHLTERAERDSISF